MRLDIKPCERPPLALRSAYFASLSDPQIHYVEKRVAAAAVFSIGPADASVGYMAIDAGAVVEFYVKDALLPQLSEVFYEAARHGGATSAVLKSYDQLAIAAVSGRPTEMITLGVNATRWSDERFEPPPGFRHRLAASGDAGVLLGVGSGLFETQDELQDDLQAGRVILYELDGAPIGCGVL